MPFTLLRAYRLGGDVGVGKVGVAAAPSGGFYLAELEIGGEFALCLVRTTSAGAVSWQKALDISSLGGSTSPPMVISNATHVALLLEDYDYGTSKFQTHAFLYTSAGSLVWQALLPIGTLGRGLAPGRVAMDASNNLVVAALDETGTNSVIMKIAGSTGAIAWAVNTRHTSASTGVDWTGPVALLSGGDIVAAPLGNAHSGSFRAYIQRLSGADGSVVWSRSIVWPIDSETGIAVDPSDNIYAWGTQYSGTNGPELPVVKLDSSGTTLWNEAVKSGTSQGSDPFLFVDAERGMANSSGVFIPCDLGPAPTTGKLRYGYVYIPAGGSSGATVFYILSPSTSDMVSITTAGESATEFQFGFVDTPSEYRAILVTASSSTADDGTYGSYSKASAAFTLVSGAASLASATYTRASTGSFTAGSPPTLPALTGHILIDPIAVTTVSYAVTSLGVVTNFGTPSNSPRANSIGEVTNFGTPSLLPVAVALGPTATFGTPVGTPSPVTCSASSMGAVTQFGSGWVYKDWTPDSARWAVWGEPQTRFGTPTAAASINVSASGWLTSQFGTPTSPRTVAASGFQVSQFGSPTGQYAMRAGGFQAARFGTPAAQSKVIATGFSRTMFGTPAAAAPSVRTASGFQVTNFGAVATHTAVRTRSAYFRTHFGDHACERTVA